MHKLSARAFRDDDGTWTIEIPELTSTSPSGATIVATGSATTFRGVSKAARDLASAWLDVEPAEVEVAVAVDAPDNIVQMIRESDRAEEEGNRARARGAQLRREAVQALREQGYPLEAAASVLGVSFQRVQKLAG
ncbi:hypothetical protein RS85_03509 [Microbacterium sp. SA39]|nr:hypothetical protein RS85_03509 [Microbacterium sp. SA39]